MVAHSGTVRASGQLQSGRTCDVKLDVADALGVGHSMRSLVRSGRIPAGVAEVFERVAKQLISSARIEVIGGTK